MIKCVEGRAALLVLLLCTFAAGASDARGQQEFSGIVLSRQYPGIFWTHNDSGDLPRIFSLRGNGKQVATVMIQGANNIDWEDITADDQGYLYLCDIGNNLNLRKVLSVYKIGEPDPFTDSAVPVLQRFDFRYPDQTGFPMIGKFNFDAEACFWDDDSLYILTKHRSDRRTKLYRLDLGSGETVQTLTLLSEYEIGGMVTGAELSPDQSRLAVLTYKVVHVFEKTVPHGDYFAGQHRKIPIRLTNAEGVCFEGQSLVILNEEGKILRLPLH